MTTGHTHDETDHWRRPIKRNGESGDYSRMRHQDKLTKWVVGVVCAMIVASVYAFGGDILSMIKGNNVGMIQNREQLGLVKKDVEYMQKDVRQLKEGQKQIREDVRAGQQQIIDTLYTLPADRRNQPKPVISPPPSRDEDR